MKRLSVDAVALALALACTWLVAVGVRSQATLDEVGARTEAASYLSAAPRRADLVAERWAVTDGAETAWLDARTGDLVEIEFATSQDAR